MMVAFTVKMFLFLLKERLMLVYYALGIAANTLRVQVLTI